MSGDNQIGFSNVTSIMNGKAQNLPLKPIAAGVSGAATEDEAWDALLAPKGGVTDLKQLEGKKVSVNTLKNLPEVAVRNSLEKAGVDLVEGGVRRDPVPRRPGRARGQARGRGVRGRAVRRRLAWPPARRSSPTPFEELAPDLTIAEYFTTEQYAKENADVVAARRRRTSPRWGAWRTSVRDTLPMDFQSELTVTRHYTPRAIRLHVHQRHPGLLRRGRPRAPASSGCSSTGWSRTAAA